MKTSGVSLSILMIAMVMTAAANADIAIDNDQSSAESSGDTAVFPTAGTHSGKKPKAHVLQSELLGRYIEDLDYLPNGPFAKHLVMLNGYEIHGLRLNRGARSPIRKLIDLRQADLISPPNGMAYVSSERLFALLDPNQPTKLLFVDHRGNPQPSRSIQYARGQVPALVDGLTYLPEDSQFFPDHLLTTTIEFIDVRPYLLCHIQVIHRDGFAATEIPIPENVCRKGVYEVALLDSRGLLVSTEGAIVLLDFDGNLISRPIRLSCRPAGCFPFPAEGIVRIDADRFVASQNAHLRFFDSAPRRLRHEDRHVGTEAGIVSAQGIAWNPDTLQHLVAGVPERVGPELRSDFTYVAAVPLALDTSSIAVDLFYSEPFEEHPFPEPAAKRFPKVTYVPEEQLVAISLYGYGRPSMIAFHDNTGTLTDLISLSTLGENSFIIEFDYIPLTREFVIVEAATPNVLVFLTRDGILARTIDLSGTGINYISALAFFNPHHRSGGQFLIFGDPERAIILDLNGKLKNEFNFRKELGVREARHASAITNGPLAGAFTVIEGQNNSQHIVFKLK